MIRDVDLSTKEAYLAWVQEWKGWWKATVAQIRLEKKRRYWFRKRGRQLDEAHYPEARRRAYEQMAEADWRRRSLRNQARTLIEIRLEAKIQSWEKRCEALRQEGVAVSA